ncbi:MAG: hypothetical protein ACJ768_17040 [Gaiellaceae bacterium]
MSDDWWVDYRQNRRIEELQGEVEAAYSYAASRSRALQSKLSEVQGTLERRLDRLATSFDAFVELSDIRLELAVFDREAAVRHRTRRLLMGLAQRAADPPPLGLDDAPGYWLKPAADGLSALVRGDDADAEKFTAQAAERDEDRTTLFLTLGLAVAGRYPEAVPWLSRALPALGTTVTTVQRRLWMACADGAFGEPGRAHVERRLTELLDELPPEAAEAERATWAQAVAGPVAARRSSLPRELQSETTLTEPPVAATRLTRLRTRVEEALSPVDGAPAAEFATLLNTLVDEGSPEERPLMARARELRQIIEHGGTEQHTAWDAPAGETLALLRADMFDRGEPGPRALALRVGRPWLRAIAGELAGQAAVRPPDTVDVRLSGHPLRIGTDGCPDLAEAQAAIDSAAATSRGGERLGLVVAVIGVAVTVLTIAAGLPGLAVLTILMIVVGVGVWIKLRSDRVQARESAEHDKTHLARQVEQIADTLKQGHTRHKELIATAQADRETILTLLA